MNQAQQATLYKLSGWEVQTSDSGPYLKMGWILPDGTAVGDRELGPSIQIVTHPEGTISIGKPA